MSAPRAPDSPSAPGLFEPSTQTSAGLEFDRDDSLIDEEEMSAEEIRLLDEEWQRIERGEEEAYSLDEVRSACGLDD